MKERMKITADVRRVLKEDKVKGIANILFEGEFLVKNVRIVEGKNGLFIAMPSRRKADGNYEDVCFPITKEMRAEIEQVVIAGYEEALKKEEEEQQENSVPQEATE